MLIDKYVENALYLYQCVIIPGFGGFVAREEDSFESAEHGKYSPRSKKFVFNRSLRVNDGVLASYIAGMRDITYAEALSEISHAVDFYISQLEKGDAVEISGVGVIKAEGGRWTFEPSEVKNFSREEYGLVSSVPSAESGDGQIPVKHEHISDQMSRMPSQADHAEIKVKAVNLVVDAATNAGIEDNAVENRAIGNIVNAVLMEAMEKATLDNYVDSDHAARSLISSVVGKVRRTEDDAQREAMDSILRAVMTEAVEKALLEQQAGCVPPASGMSESGIPAREDHDVPQSTEENNDDIIAAEEQYTAVIEEISGGSSADESEKRKLSWGEGEKMDDEPHRKRGLSKIIWAGLAVAVAFILLLVYMYWAEINHYFYYAAEDSRNTAVQQDAVAPVPQTSVPAVSDSVKNVSDTVVKAQAQAVDSVLQTGDFEPGYVPGEPYYVIAGSMRSLGKARALLADLKSKGYDAVYAGRQGSLYMVAYGGFASMQQAEELREKIEESENPEVWIKVYPKNRKK